MPPANRHLMPEHAWHITPPKRYCIIHRESLASLLGLKDVTRLPDYHHQWIEEALNGMGSKRQSIWSEGVVVGNQRNVESVMVQLGVRQQVDLCTMIMRQGCTR